MPNTNLRPTSGYGGGANVSSAGPAGLTLPAYTTLDANGFAPSDPGYQVVKQTAGGPAPGQSAKTFTGEIVIPAGAGTTTQALETVTALKTLYLTDISITADTAQIFRVRIQAGGVDIFRGLCKGDTGPIQFPGIETQPQAAAGSVVNILFVAVAGFLITNAEFFIAGFES
jgi:hypothetical protein